MPDDTQGVLKANDAFYKAFVARDLNGMDNLWARAGSVSCIHPGWDVLTDRKRIIDSWKNIFSSPDSPNIAGFAGQITFLETGDNPIVAIVVCHELINGKPVLIATNIFHNENGTWVMVHHQAGHFNDRISEPVPGRTDIVEI